MKSGARLRAEAAIAIESVVKDGRSLDSALLKFDDRISAADRSLAKMLCYGTLRHHWRLRSQLAQLLDRPLKARDSVIESLLAVGLFQMTDTRIPDHAAVSTTVEAARHLRRPKYAGLINAVLRNFQRRKLIDAAPVDDESAFNHPQWIIDRLREDWPEDWQQILESNNERAAMWLRVNRRHMTVDEYQQASDEKLKTLIGLDQAVCLASPKAVEDLPAFADGLVTVQDGAAQIAAPWLLRDGGRRILDACAAPGGKTGHLLELAEPGAELTAIDIDAERVGRIHEHLERLQLNATVLAGDASTPEAWWDGEPFDRILLDAPCSASGVIRRHPDIKLLRRAADIDSLAELQARMLDGMWTVLAPAGRLLYVTCSVFAAENDAVIEAFLQRYPDAQEDRVLQNNNIRDLMREKTRGFQVLPGTQGLDGFYFACLQKTS